MPEEQKIDREIQEAQDAIAKAIRAILDESEIEPVEFLFDTQEFDGEKLTISFLGQPRQNKAEYPVGIYQITLMGDNYVIRLIQDKVG